MGVVLGPSASPWRAEDLRINRGHGNTNGEKRRVVHVEEGGIPRCDLNVEHLNRAFFQDKAMSRLAIDRQRGLCDEHGCGEEHKQCTRKSSV